MIFSFRRLLESILGSWSGETTVADRRHVTWRGDHRHQPQQGRSMIPEAKWGPFWPMPKQGNAWSQSKTIWCWKPFNRERRTFGAHTQKNVNVLAAKTKTQQAQSLDVREWSTVKNKLMPQGQRDRPHWRKCTARNKFVPQGSKRSTPPKEVHCKK